MRIRVYFSNNLLAACAYFAAGWLGTLLATPPSNASPIWPAAGVALAMMLVYGKPVMPGIFMGALATQFYAFLDVSSFDKVYESIGIGALAGIGSTLQAWCGMALIEHWVGRHDPLIDDRKILRFFLLIAGSCTVSATIGIGSLFFRHVIGAPDLLNSWAIWWVGDVIGTAICAPLFLVFIGQPRSIWKARRWPVFYPLLVAILLVVAVFEFSLRQEQARLQTQFERQVDLLYGTVKERLNDHLSANSALRALFDSSERVEKDEFTRFAASIRQQCSGVLEWTPRVKQAERAEWERTYRRPIRQLAQQGGTETAQPRAEYFPVTFLVPEEGNEPAFGFDIGSNPQVADVINKAIDSGQAMATGGIRLVQDEGARQGAVIYSPVYRKQAGAIDSV